MQFAKINAARARDLPSGLAMAWQSDLEDQYRIPHSTMQQIQTLNILLKIWLHGLLSCTCIYINIKHIVSVTYIIN